MIFKTEPALIIGLINALIALGVGFGLPVTPAQVGLINAAVAAVLAIVMRGQAVPTAVADKQIEIAKAADITTPTQQIIQQAKEQV